MRWRAGFGDCDDLPATDNPGQRNSGCRALMRHADLRQRSVGYHEIIVAAERRIRHHRHIVLRAPRQEVALDATVVETVRDLIGCAAIAAWNPKQIFHLTSVEVGYAPRS